ncbi:hypothetical protein PORCAN_1221 [Porphyromonas crevioricanis JCM 13913]|nr:hypothetical protein PORCAN_1221 [Porphyromonas crevioricanis JCM 13913]
MELKRTLSGGITRRYIPLNRTILELKHLFDGLNSSSLVALNRTILELKLGRSSSP